MTNFESHWDYTNHTPMHQPQRSGDKPKRDSFELLLKCNANTKRRQHIEYRLEDFWRFGIPNNYRRVLWPFAIQNKFGLSRQLYEIKLTEGLKSKNTIFIEQIQRDVKQFQTECCDRESLDQLAKA